MTAAGWQAGTHFLTISLHALPWMMKYQTHHIAGKHDKNENNVKIKKDNALVGNIHFPPTHTDGTVLIKHNTFSGEIVCASHPSK